MSLRLFDLNPALDPAPYAKRFAETGRVQLRDVLTVESAQTIRNILQRETPWGIAWQAGEQGPAKLRNEEIRALSAEQRRDIGTAIQQSAAQGDYAVQFCQYPILDAYLGRWRPDGPHDLLLEHINDRPFMDLVRAVTGMPDLKKADAQATLYGPGDFLSLHSDSHVADGWRVAYVLNFADPEWKPDWGGYLNFLDDDGDIVEGWRPRFNALNLLKVPQLHNVSYVPPFAPLGRFAITGWFRDR